MKFARLAVAMLFLAPAAANRELAAAEAKKRAYSRDRAVTYSAPGGKPLKAEVYAPKGAGPFPGVLVVHGGAWRMGNRFHLAWAAERLAEAGYTAVAIDYRLAPTHKYPAQTEDCQAAVRWLRTNAKKYRVDPEHIGGYGYSAGGHLVALLGVLGDDESVALDPAAKQAAPRVIPMAAGKSAAPSARLQAVVAGGAPVNFELLPKNADVLKYWLGGTRAENPDVYRQASPTAHVSADDPPMLFFHGAADVLVPRISPELMVRKLAAAKVPAKVHIVEKAGHIQAMFDAEALERSIAFFDERLKPKREMQNEE